MSILGSSLSVTPFLNKSSKNPLHYMKALDELFRRVKIRVFYGVKNMKKKSGILYLRIIETMCSV